MDVSPLVWWLTIGITTAVLLFDIVVIGRRPHEPSRKEVTIALAFFIGLAIAFGIGVWVFAGHQYGTEFFAGWLTEYSLSVDNLFIFLIIMNKFAVPRKLPAERTAGRHRARAGDARHLHRGRRGGDQQLQLDLLHLRALPHLHGGQARQGGRRATTDEFEENRLIKWVESTFPRPSEWHGTKLVRRGERQAG